MELCLDFILFDFPTMTATTTTAEQIEKANDIEKEIRKSFFFVNSVAVFDYVVNCQKSRVSIRKVKNCSHDCSHGNRRQFNSTIVICRTQNPSSGKVPTK